MAAGRSIPHTDLSDLLRGLCGGFIFAVPIIYTMEMWWRAHDLASWKLLLFFGLAYFLSAGLNLVSGFREDRAGWEVFADALESLALGVVVAAVMLWMLGVINHQSSLVVVLRQVMLLAVPISIGVSLAQTQLVGPGDDSPDANGPVATRKRIPPDVLDFAMTVVGGIFLGFSVAPTEEILVMGMQGDLSRWLAMVSLSLGIIYLTLFQAGFGEAGDSEQPLGMYEDPVRKTVVAYGIALVVSYGLLWFLGFFKGDPSLTEQLVMVVCLAFPVSLGGAVGRLIL